jgi:phosphoribosylanthranilate isomerase
MLKTKVKASAVANLTDARYFAAWGVEWLGFNFDPGAESYIEPPAMQAIREWVDGVKIVGEFGLQPFAEIRDAVQLLRLDAVQVGMYSPLSAADAAALGVPLIREIVLERPADLEAATPLMDALSSATDFFLLDFEKNHLAWHELDGEARAMLQTLSRQYLLLLSIAAAAEEMHELLDTLHPYGINLRGGQEEKVGFKSFDELDEVFEVLEG